MVAELGLHWRICVNRLCTRGCLQREGRLLEGTNHTAARHPAEIALQ